MFAASAQFIVEDTRKPEVLTALRFAKERSLGILPGPYNEDRLAYLYR